jgi:hypothetical protein
MELRVLHPVAFQKTWYGQWGYVYGRGGFNISRQTWKKVTSALAGMPLAGLHEVAAEDEKLGRILARCQVRVANGPRTEAVEGL